jgi:hypothetical protein
MDVKLAIKQNFLINRMYKLIVLFWGGGQKCLKHNGQGIFSSATDWLYFFH